MQELDLTPFKVEFDREITINDAENGDIIRLASDTFRIPSEHDLFLYCGSIYIGYTLLHRFIVLQEPNISYTNPRVTPRNIKAIYRINRFKY